jgi:hypothetical protein
LADVSLRINTGTGSKNGNNSKQDPVAGNKMETKKGKKGKREILIVIFLEE